MAIILSMASGSCGTGYVAQTIDELDGCYCRWEEKAVTRSRAITLINNSGDLDERERTWQLIYADMLKEEEEHGTYIEISHRFIKGWLTTAARDILALKLINVKRNLVDVAYNFCISGYFHSKGSHRGVLSPYWKYNVTSLPDFQNATPIQKSIWYVVEIEERKKKFMADHPYIPVCSFELEKRTLNDWAPLIDFVGLKMNERFEARIRRDYKVNKWRGNRRDVYKGAVTLEDVKREFDKYTITYSTNGVYI